MTTKNRAAPAQLFTAFLKVGAMTFGGGYAMLPMLEREIINNRRWITYEELMDFYAIAQATPGVIAVNVATLLGYRQARFKGALAATIGVVLPAMLVIMLIASFIDYIAQSAILLRVFAAMQICVGALVINAVIPFFKRGIKDAFTLLLFLICFCAFYFFKTSPALLVLICAAAGVLVYGGKK
ncbi:MAG: chromate transporter [Elusimicrobiota bacterium]|jgi:chromate transporter|nr:chromate transporter [Elusimicrobiota bacterium]